MAFGRQKDKWVMLPDWRKAAIITIGIFAVIGLLTAAIFYVPPIVWNYFFAIAMIVVIYGAVLFCLKEM